MDDCLVPFLRRATRNDLPRIKEIRFAVKENVLIDRTSIPDEEVFRFMEDEVFWVYEENGLVLGFAAGDTRDGNIWALFVHPEYEGRGVGQALLDQCCRSLAQRGLTRLKLDTGPQTRAAAFYRRAGWRETGETTAKGNVVFSLTVPSLA